MLFIFGCAGSLLLGGLLSSFGESGADSQRVDFSLRWLLLLKSTGSIGVAHGLRCPVAGGIVLGQGWYPCHLQ